MVIKIVVVLSINGSMSISWFVLSRYGSQVQQQPGSNMTVLEKTMIVLKTPSTVEIQFEIVTKQKVELPLSWETPMNTRKAIGCPC